MTIETDIEAALFARVATLVLSPVLAVAWPNVSFPPPTAGYLRVDHLPNTSNRLLIGTGKHQRQGLMQLSVFKPKGAGAAIATETAGLVAAWFPADLKLYSGAVRVRVTKAPDIAAAMADDPYWHVPVTVSYEAFA